jgi:hypothetical protein
MKSINYICSLGTLCHTGSWIKQMEMKKCSFPFDWVFSNLNMIIDCIDNDFVKFLDRGLHIPNEKHKNNKRMSGHKVYGGNIFHHHNILEDDTYNYFSRCVDRFRILTKKEENKLFIISFVNKKENISKEFESDIVNLYNKLTSIANNFDLLVVYHKLGTKLGSEIVKLNKNTNIIVISTQSASNGMYIQNDIENTFYNNCIFKLYDFKLVNS